MVAAKNAEILLIFFVLFLGSCEGCQKSTSQKSEVVASTATDKNRFTIEPETLFKLSENFSYSSLLTVSLGKGETSEDSEEIVEITSARPRVLLKKKVDNSHFFAIFKDGDDYFVQNQGGSFRKSSDSKHLYESLLKDSFNVTAWLVDQFALSDNMMTKQDKGKSTVFLMPRVTIPADSPFVKNLAIRRPLEFSRIESASVFGSIELDKKTSLPTLANFEIAIVGQGQHWIKMKALSSLDTKSTQNLVLPNLVEDEQINVPINRGKRFNELLGLEQGVR